MPERCNSRCRARRSEVLPSPGAPATIGTRAETGPDLATAAVTGGGVAVAGRAAAGVAGGAAELGLMAAVCTRPLAGAGAVATAGACLGSQPPMEVTVLLAIAAITVGVSEAQGSGPLPAGADSSPLTR